MAAPEIGVTYGGSKISEVLDGLSITWKDGLPDDPAERSTIEATLITSGLTSKYSAIKRLLDGDDDAAQAEMLRIAQEQQSSMQRDLAMQVAADPMAEEDPNSDVPKGIPSGKSNSNSEDEETGVTK